MCLVHVVATRSGRGVALITTNEGKITRRYDLFSLWAENNLQQGLHEI